MGTAMAHRGPDDAGQQSWDEAGLAFRRLALVDIEGGAQPASEATGRFWSVFNGEIYNHRELRAELASHGHQIAGSGDAALIPSLFQQWGPSMLGRLRGMFALAVYDRQNQELFLARDAFGIKPLYWTQRDGALFFASEIGALRAGSAVGRDVAPQALSHYLSFGYVPDPSTMWPGVHMLPAGHSLRLRSGQVQVQRWWTPEFTSDDTTTAADLVAELTSRLENSVAAHLDADVPVGAYLSSGVDSSLLVALANRRQPVETFSIGFAEAAGGLDELIGARRLAQQLGTNHHEQVVTAAEYWTRLPEIVAGQEEPLADPSAPALWFLAREASATVKAVLSGEGADELFGGYPLYREPRALAPVSGLPQAVQAPLRRLAARLPEGRRGKSYLTRATTPLEHRFLGNAPLFSDQAKDALLQDTGAVQESPWERVQPAYARTEHLDEVSRMQAVSCDTWLPSSILMKADKMAMAHSLEVRVPYLDREVFDLARRLPSSLRVDRRNTKVALRLAAAQHLPAEIAWRPKLGFPVPFRSWLDGPVGQQVRELFDSCDDPLLSKPALQQLLEHQARPGQQRRIWGVMVYLFWRQAHVSGEPAFGQECPPPPRHQPRSPA